MRAILAAMLITAFLSACAGPVIQPPPPTPQVITAAFTPATRTWQPAFQACADTDLQMRLLREEKPWTHMALEDGLSVRLGSPTMETPYFAVQIGEEQIVVIVNPENPLEQLSAEVLRAIYSGQYTMWNEGVLSYAQDLHVWSYPESNELSQIFLSALWQANPPVIMAYLVPDPEAMVEAVRADPGAIGFIPASWLTHSAVKSITMETEVLHALLQPVLVISNHEPQGLERILISCLQANPK